MRLHEVSDALARLLESIEDADQFEHLADTLESLDLVYEEKIDQLGKSRANDLAHIGALDDEIKRLQEKKAKLKKRVEGVEKYIHQTLIKNNQKSVKTTLFTFGFRKSTSLVVTDISKLPERFLKPQEPKPDVAGLKKHLKESFAEKNLPIPDDMTETLGVRFEHKQSLQIK